QYSWVIFLYCKPESLYVGSLCRIGKVCQLPVRWLPWILKQHDRCPVGNCIVIDRPALEMNKQTGDHDSDKNKCNQKNRETDKEVKRKEPLFPVKFSGNPHRNSCYRKRSL